MAAIYRTMPYTSPTFDEVAMLGGIASGVHTGRYDLVLAEPPLPQWVYGASLRTVPMHYPPEPTEADKQQVGICYRYAQNLLYRCGNDADRITAAARRPAPWFVALLGLAVFGFVRSRASDGAALQAGALTVFLPDLLGHGGLAYSDVPCTLMGFCAVWAVDSALRPMTVRRGLLAGLALGAAQASKYSNLPLFGVAIVLLWLESRSRGAEPDFNRKAALFVGAVAVGTWAALAVFFQDPLLRLWLGDAMFVIRHVEQGDTAFLLGQLSQGFWYFFPVALVLKTTTAWQASAVLALFGVRRGEGSTWRAPLVTTLTLLAVYLHARLDIGFRHAMPVLPWLCVLIAAGCEAAWQRRGRGVAVLAGLLTAAHVALSLSWCPFFLPYVSEYITNRDHGYQALADSSLDWGQGLYLVREYVHEHGNAPVYLAWFGSALPDGYGIHAVPLPGFFKLQRQPVPTPAPSTLIISATLLDGLCISPDWYAPLRQIEPDEVLGHTMFIYRTDRPEVHAVLHRLHMDTP